MPSVDELLLNSIDTLDDVEALEETNKYCEIDETGRVIVLNDLAEILGVENDKAVERVYFRCPRYVGDNVDLDITQCTVYINFQNANMDKDQYIVTDLNTDETDSTKVTFSWLLSKKVTQYKGVVNFIVCARKTKTGGEIEQEWNTTLAKATVLEGLEPDPYVVPSDDLDVVNQLMDLVKQEIEQKGQETIDSIPEDYTSLSEELVDVRVGVDGKTYTSAGEAVRKGDNDSFRYRGNISGITPFSEYTEIGTYSFNLSNMTDNPDLPPITQLEGRFNNGTLINIKGWAYGDYLLQRIVFGETNKPYIWPDIWERLVKISTKTPVFEWTKLCNETLYNGVVGVNQGELLVNCTTLGSYSLLNARENIEDIPETAKVSSDDLYDIGILINFRGFAGLYGGRNHGGFVLQILIFGRSDSDTNYQRISDVFIRLVNTTNLHGFDWINLAEQYSSYKEDTLYGKKISFLGDSITTYSGYNPSGYASYYPRGDIDSVEKTWWHKLVENTGMELVSNASWSGSTCHGDGESTTNAKAGCSNARINDLKKDDIEPDIIVILIGINDFAPDDTPVGDWSPSDPIPEDSNNIATFSDAYALMVSKIMNSYPKSRVFCSTLLQTGSYKDEEGTGIYPTKNGSGTTLIEYNNVIKSVSEGLGCDIIDLSACGINFWNFSTTTIDSLHPNAAGASLIAKKAEAELRSKY